MSKIRCKGTALQVSVSSVYTAISQIVSLELPDMQSETYESDTLDNATAGILYDSTGRTEGGSCSGELFLDPALSIHKTLLGFLTTPGDQSYKIIFANASATEWPFTGAGFQLGGTVALKDGLKAKFSIKLDGIPTFPA